MLIENIIKLQGSEVVWEKYNLHTGLVETLHGTLLQAGTAPLVGNIEYAVVEDSGGREWVTLASCIKVVCVKQFKNK